MISINTKTRILALLESKRGQNISGEHIAKQLNVSRNSIWKAISELRKDGYLICAVTKVGYCLSEDNDIISAQGIQPFLSAKNVSANIIVHEMLESTNKTAKELAISGAQHGTVIIADSQSAGVGRYGRQFHSPPGHGIYMSMILHPARIRFATPTLITSFAAVAVCEAVEAVSGAKPQIKWVNDIFLDGKKICGILTEAAIDFEGGGTQWIILGIGINFSTPIADFPSDLQQIAGAVFANVTPPTSRNHLIAEIMNRITEPCSEKDMLDKYRKRLMMLGKDIVVIGSGAGEPYEAKAIDIDSTGRLVVAKRDSGEIISLSSGEISIRQK